MGESVVEGECDRLSLRGFQSLQAAAQALGVDRLEQALEQAAALVGRVGCPAVLVLLVRDPRTGTCSW